MPTQPHDPPHDPETLPGKGPEVTPPGLEPREPSWSDIIGGVWDRLTHPGPR
jgi:hypothetical protein